MRSGSTIFRAMVSPTHHPAGSVRIQRRTDMLARSTTLPIYTANPNQSSSTSYLKLAPHNASTSSLDRCWVLIASSDRVGG